jgi:hypothetical protein
MRLLAMELVNKIALVDADTIIYAAAAMIQSNVVIATHINSGKTKEFRNVTAFRAFLKEKDGKWHENDFAIEVVTCLDQDVRGAFRCVKDKIDSIIAQPWCRNAELFIGGEGNFRKEAAVTLPYKGNRGVKPLAFNDTYEYFLKKYKAITTVCHGEEAEDGVAVRAWSGWEHAMHRGEYIFNPYVICRVDKDLKQVPGFHFNYNRQEQGVELIDETQAAYWFWLQMLMGDPTDNIQGLQNLHYNTAERYGVRKGGRGVGEATAEKMLLGAATEKEMAYRVREAYQEFYGDDWEESFNEQGVLLRMRRRERERFVCSKYVEGL